MVMEHTISFAVSKSIPVLVGPCVDTPTGNLTLSPLDKMPLLRMSIVRSLHMFRHSCHEPAKTIRHALSQALVYYYPLAGRLVEPHDGELAVSCTGNGVGFVEATVNCSLEDVKFLEPPLAMPLHELVPNHDRWKMSDITDPLVLVQVTEFSCGGFVVGVSWYHVLADGTGMAQFLNAVGELAHGLPHPTIVPVRSAKSVANLIPKLSSRPLSFPVLEPHDFAYSDVIIPLSYIDRIKVEFQNETDQTCTVFEVAMAVLWQCRTRAINPDPDALMPLVFSTNVRTLVPADKGYYGNCTLPRTVRTTCSMLLNASTIEVIKMIKAVKAQTSSEFAKWRKGELENDGLSVHGSSSYNTLFASSWRNLGFETVNYGGGRPIRVMLDMDDNKYLPICVPGLPCTRVDGINILARCLKEEHSAAFHAQVQQLK